MVRFVLIETAISIIKFRKSHSMNHFSFDAVVAPLDGRDRDVCQHDPTHTALCPAILLPCQKANHASAASCTAVVHELGDRLILSLQHWHIHLSEEKRVLGTTPQLVANSVESLQAHYYHSSPTPFAAQHGVIRTLSLSHRYYCYS